MKKKRKGITGGIHRCPYCGSPVTYRSADGIYSCKEIGKKLHMRTNIVTAQMSKARKYLRKIPELNDLYFAGDAI